LSRKGFAPAPTAIKLLKGVQPKRINKREAHPPVGDVPVAPPHLSEVAQREWTRLVPDLAACGLLTRIDHAALEGYCETRARVLALEMELRTDKPVIYTKKGWPILNPKFTALQSEYKQLMRFFIEFGMTPSARSRIQIEPKAPEEGDLAAFRRKHG
jgi:P27 family predicted phage terminase small subunit